MIRSALHRFSCSELTLLLRSSLTVLLAFAALGTSGVGQSAYVGHTLGASAVAPVYSPSGGAVDANGNFYFSDQNSQTVVKIPVGCVSSACTITLGGASSFSYPSGVAVDSSGNVYVADTGNSLLKEIPVGCFSDSCVLTLASGNQFPALVGIAVDSNGNIYFSDVNLHAVFEMTSPDCNSPACLAALGFGINGFSQATGVAVDAGGNVYVADDGGPAVYEMTPNCVTSACVTTLGGTFAFGQPLSVALDPFGDVYVADYFAPAYNGGQIYEMPPGCTDSSCVTTVGGGYYGPTGLAVDSGGNVFVSDYLASSVREVVRRSADLGSVAVNSATPIPFTVTFTFSSNGSDVGAPTVLTQGAASLDFTDAGTGTCNTNGAGHSYTVGDTCTVDVLFSPKYAGPRYGAAVLQSSTGATIATALLSGTGTGPQIAFSPAIATQVNTTAGSPLNSALGEALDGAGNLYIADTSANRIVVVPAGGGTPTSFTVSVNGTGLFYPVAPAFDGAGNLFIADLENNRVVEVHADGSAATAFDPGLNGPDGLVFDSAGDLYISDDFNNRVLEIPVGSNSAIVINPIVDGATLLGPEGLATDPAGNLYIADTDNHRIVEVPAGGGPATAIAPTVDGLTLKYPSDVTLDAAGDMFIADFLNGRVVEIPAGGGAPFAISPVVNGKAIKYGEGVALDGQGDLFILDYTNSTVGTRILKVPYSQVPAVTFPTSTTAYLPDTTDGTMTVQVANIGNQPLNFTAVDYPADFSAASDASACDLTTPLLAGQQCDLPIQFTPQSAGAPLSENVLLTDNNLNGSAVQQSVAASGTSTPFVTPQITSPSPGTLAGSTATFTWDPGNATLFQFRLGTILGANDVYSSGRTTLTTLTVNNLPTEAHPLHARLYYQIAGAWHSVDYLYTEAGAFTLPSIMSPSPGSTLTGSTVTFSWDPGSSTRFQFRLGTVDGSNNLYGSGATYKNSVSVSGLPTDGKPIHARLYYMVNGAWQFIDYTFTAN